MLSRRGALAGVSGARKRMPVTCVASVLMPSVAKGVRTQAAKASVRGSAMRFSGERADLRQQLGGNLHARRGRLGLGAAAVAGRAHAFFREHRAPQRLDALEVGFAPGERARVDGEEALADARRAALF